MRLSELQVRPLGRARVRWGAAVACCPPRSHLGFPTDKNVVSESPDETQAPTAGLAAQRPPPRSSLRAPGFLPTAYSGQRPAAAVPLGISASALGAGTAPWHLLGPLPSGACLRGLSVGPKRQAASAVLPARPWEPGARAGPGLVHRVLGPVFPAGDWGCLLRTHGCPEACSWRHKPAILRTRGAFTAVPGIYLARQMFSIYTDITPTFWWCLLPIHRCDPGP